ncbi:unnamed protein product [Ectocarpus sp. 12 AP-2014]
MSVNRRSDLDTSLSRTDGVHRKYLNLSSADRDKTLYPDSADAELAFDDQSNVIGMKILNFEIPHTRYAIDSTTNNFYISEKRGEDEYYFYSWRVSPGAHSIQNLCVALTLSSKCPVMFNGDRDMGNEYTVDTSLLFGKVAIVSSGDYEYNIHASTATVTLSSIIVKSDTEAVLSYLAPSKQVYKPGALLVFQPYTYADRDVQVVENIESSGQSEVRVIGDFSDLDWENMDVSLSRMVPYAGVNSMAKITGFGDSDLADQSNFEVLSIGSPFSSIDTLEDASVMVSLDKAPFLSAGDCVRLSGVPGFMNDMVCTVAVVHDETHLEIYVDRAALWSHDSGTLSNMSNPGVEWGVEDINLSDVNSNVVEVLITPSSPTTLSAGDVVVFGGFHSEEFQDLHATVVLVDEDGGITVQFDYPTILLFEDGVTSMYPVNPDTTLGTTYIAPNRFDLSRGRRMVLCRAVVDNQDVGSIHIPSLSTRSFFGRIQLFSGANLVNFLGKDTAVGSHEFNSVMKRINKIRFQFYNEDGTTYDFIGVDYTMFLELVCLDSNRGL